jgi:hypothetical protein
MTPTHKNIPAVPAAPRAARFGIFRFSTAQFLAALVLLLVGSPFLMHFRDGDLIETMLMMLVLLSGVLAAGGRKTTLIIAAILVAPAVVGKGFNHFRPDLCPASFFQAAVLMFFLFMVGHLLLFIFRAPRVNSEVLCAAVSTYLMLGLLWMFGYMILARTAPDSFAFSAGPSASQSMDNFTAFYFSFVTLCTVGFGDVTPVSHLARMMAVMEAITGTFYMTLLIARLVALYSSASPSGGMSDPALPSVEKPASSTPQKPASD